jgi:ankyrin repeat protein
MLLYRALWNGHLDIVQLLLAKGANIESKDTKYGQTLLLCATVSRHEAVVILLLNNSADIDSENSSSLTALQLVTFRGHEGIEGMLGIYRALEPEDFYRLQKLFL